MKPISALTGLGLLAALYLLATLIACTPQDPQQTAKTCAQRGFTPETEAFMNCQIEEGMKQDQAMDELKQRYKEQKAQDEFYKSTRMR
jgi:hypothetical protein